MSQRLRHVSEFHTQILTIQRDRTVSTHDSGFRRGVVKLTTTTIPAAVSGRTYYYTTEGR